MTTLQAHEFVQLDVERGVWLIGVGAFRVGNAFLRSRRLVTLGREVMHRVMEGCGETVNLGVEDDGEVVFISQAESHAPMRAFFRPGRRGPMHASGIGKALLAAQPDEAVRRILHRKGLARFTDKTLVEPSALFGDLQQIRERGWSIDDEEHTLGMRCLAAPIYNEHGEAIAGVSISGPTVRLPDARLGELGPQIKRAADEITTSIGGAPPL